LTVEVIEDRLTAPLGVLHDLDRHALRLRFRLRLRLRLSDGLLDRLLLHRGRSRLDRLYWFGHGRGWLLDCLDHTIADDLGQLGPGDLAGVRRPPRNDRHVVTRQHLDDLAFDEAT